MTRSRKKKRSAGAAPATKQKGAAAKPLGDAGGPRTLIAAAAAVIVLLGAVALWKFGAHPSWNTQSTAAPEPAFVGRAACAACHAREDSLWKGSHHDLAMQPASAATVLGNFNGTTFTHFGVTSTFSTHDGKYFVNTDGPDGKPADYQIAYTFGVYPLQQYLIAFPGGRYQALNVVWDTRPASEGGQRWFHLYPKEAVPHDDVLHWTGAYQNWNFMCAECHSTNVVKGYDAATGAYHTTFSEVDVSCEACHGPGAAHAAWAKAAGKSATGGADDGLMVQLRDPVPASWIVDTATGLPHRSVPRASHAEVEMCARCHARRSVLAEHFTPGRPLTDTHRPSLLTEQEYFADGQIRDEVYEYASFRESRMYHQGVTCTDCHDPHRATIAPPVDNVCARCHTASVFAAESHTHHKAGSPGASCVNCHMPTRDYMVVHARHDHSIRIPRPDVSVALGTPNACTGCHTKQTDQWAAAASAKWWTKRAGERPFGAAIDLGRKGSRGAAQALVALAQDTAAPAIVRATAVELLGRYPSPNMLSQVQRSFSDADPLARDAAVNATAGIPPDQRDPMLVPMLTDSSRLVRVDAARALAGALPASMTPEDSAAFHRAIAEYRAEQQLNADRAEARLNLGAYFAETGHLDSAALEYEAALKMNPSLIATYVNLADLARQRGDNAAAEKILMEGLAHAPAGQGAELEYALGLTYVREKRMNDAIGHLAAAASMSPESARYALVYALGLEELGRNKEAKDVLAFALQKHPDDRDLVNAYVALVKPKSGT
jgi:tetratricopeptide (TPR) repeat protein/mono/diheme cytochrome c family protein